MIKFPIMVFDEFWPPAKIEPAIPLSPPVNEELPEIAGVVEEGQTLTASTGSWDANPPELTYAYQWQSFNGENVSNISGATASTLELTENLVGLQIRVQVTATNTQGSDSATSEYVGPVLVEFGPPTLESIPEISGIVEVDETVTTSDGSWTANPVITGYTYKWFTRDQSEVMDELEGETADSLLIANSHIGLEIAVEVTATNDEGSNTGMSDWSSPVPDPYYVPTPTVIPVTSGTPEVGQTLSVTNGTWDANPPVSSYEYRWQQRTTGGGTPSLIPGETSNTILLTEAQEGMDVRAQVRAINSVGPSVFSLGTTNYVGPVTNPFYIPENITPPVLTGNVEVGEILTTSDGTWDANPTETGYEYRWQLDETTEIAGETTNSLEILIEYEGMTIRSQVRALNTQGESEWISSESTIPVPDANTANN